MGKFTLEVKESAQELQQLLRQQTQASGKERLQMLYWLKTGQVTTRRELAKRLVRDESSIYRWVIKYKQGGLKALLTVAKAPGQTARIQGEVLQALKEKLATPTGFSSYKAIQDWLAQQWNLDLPYSTVHKTVRYRLKAKLKVPRPSSTKADEVKQESDKKNGHRE